MMMMMIKIKKKYELCGHIQDNLFNNLMIECNELIINVPDDILGIDLEKEFKQNIEIAKVSGNGNSVYIIDFIEYIFFRHI